MGDEFLSDIAFNSADDRTPSRTLDSEASAGAELRQLKKWLNGQCDR
jgi:hypothetical protein